LKDEYAKAGVDYELIEPFKEAMIRVGKKTLEFPNRHNVYVDDQVLHSHGAIFRYQGSKPHIWCKTQEGLGNKNWIAEWMYSQGGKSYYDSIAIDLVLMAVNDVIAQGAMPVIYTDEVACGDSRWFSDEIRSKDFAKGLLKICELIGVAIPAGESPSLRYLINAEAPVKSAPSLSGCVTGIIAPSDRIVTGHKLKAGDHIIGVTSSGFHSNGTTLIIERVMELPDRFHTILPGEDLSIGEEALIPTRSYVALVKALLDYKVDVHAFLPGTGSGISKIAFDKRPFTYRIKTWVEKMSPLFPFMRELGVSLEGCLRTFNMGIGYYVFVDPSEAETTIDIGERAGYELLDLGVVEKGERKVIFEPENIILSPPGE